MYLQACTHGRSIVAELQVVHKKLMLVREDMGAHTAYERKRFLAELLFLLHQTSTPVLPWDCLDDPETQLHVELSWDLSEDRSPAEVDDSHSRATSDDASSAVGHVLCFFLPLS